MPNLPTLTVSDAHFARLVAAFPGTTDAEKTASYKAWLTNQLIDYVLVKEIKEAEVEYQSERLRVDAALVEQRRVKQEAIIASLPPRPAT